MILEMYDLLLSRVENPNIDKGDNCGPNPMHEMGLTALQPL